MTKRPTIIELEESPEYKKVLTLSYDNIASFVVDRLTSRSLPLISLWITTFGSVIVNIFLWVRLKNFPGHPSILLGILSGYIVIPLALAPVHEGLHWVFLKISGAKDIRIAMDLRQGIISLSAHRHVFNKRDYAIIALAPFILISAGALLLIFLLSSPWMQWVVSSVLLIHMTMCLGDIILLGCMYEHSDRETYTWDNVDARETYFFISSASEKAQ